MEVLDEKGDLCGRFGSQSGWHIVHTPDEEAVMNVLGAVYNETFIGVYNSVHGKRKNAAAYVGSNSGLDVKA